MALITAVSDLRMFLDKEKGFTDELPRINSRSEGEKSPSGPIKIQTDLVSRKSLVFNFSDEFTSAKKIFDDGSKLFKNSFNLITLVIVGGLD